MNYAATAKRVLKTIERAGKPITIVRPGTAEGWTREYDPAQMRDKWTHPGVEEGDPDIVVYEDPATTPIEDNTSAVEDGYVDPATTPVEDATSAVEDGYNASEIDGTMVQAGDRRYWVPAQGLAEPRTIDRLVDGSDSLAVVSCKRVAPGPVVILYEVQCRG